jgi:hypothetical protein
MVIGQIISGVSIRKRKHNGGVLLWHMTKMGIPNVYLELIIQTWEWFTLGIRKMRTPKHENQENIIQGPWKKRNVKIPNEEAVKEREQLAFAEELTEQAMISLIHTLHENDFDVNDNRFLHDMGFIIECVKSVIYRDMGFQHPMSDIMKELTVSTIDETNTLTTELDIDKVVKATKFVSELEDDAPSLA